MQFTANAVTLLSRMVPVHAGLFHAPRGADIVGGMLKTIRFILGGFLVAIAALFYAAAALVAIGPFFQWGFWRGLESLGFLAIGIFIYAIIGTVLLLVGFKLCAPQKLS
jgi:hypothetical protein